MSNEGTDRHHDVRQRQRYRNPKGQNQSPTLNICPPSQTYPPGTSAQGSFGGKPSTANPAPNELRLVLLGKTGAGKSATGNTILGDGQRFDAQLSMSSVTKECKREYAKLGRRNLALIDTPGLFDTDLTQEEVQQELVHCLTLCSPGPHAFLLVIPIERYTEEQQRTVDMILEMFTEEITHHTIIIFSHADRLGSTSIEDFLSKQNRKIQDLVERFGRRFVAFNNKDPSNRGQVTQLLEKVDELLVQKGNRLFTNPMLQAVLKAQRIIEENREVFMAARRRENNLPIQEGGVGEAEMRIDHDSYYYKILIVLTIFLLGLGGGLVASYVSKLAVDFLLKLLSTGAAQATFSAAMHAASVKLAMFTRCTIQ